ncbi:acetylxylan esterase [Microbispora hainanensis]|uniref:acetylxylan esterase n=1 Tax=Microbispora hainanensis TaxID=568844 RepID=UPI00142EC816|nr:acetylxylan esterase [Microbispora hainanensis]
MRSPVRAWTKALAAAVTAATLSTPLIAGPAYAAPPGSTGKDGTWTVEPVGGGHRVTLHLNTPLPVRDAVPELAADGRSLGPAEESPDGMTLTVVTPDPAVVSASSVDVAWNGEVPEAAAAAGKATPMLADPPADPPGTPGKPGKPGTPPGPPGKPDPAPVDPAAPGPYAVTHDEYDLGDTAITLEGLGGRPAEIRAKVYLPDGARGKRPLVVFLHGRHSACYNPTAWTSSNTQWPCPAGQQPIASYQGYDGPADVLASNGYVVVSVSANGVNAADNPYSEDRGALARGEVVMRHLDLLADADRGVGDAKLVSLFKGRLDMADVGLMGHSRGGEGVVKAALMNAGRAKPYGIKAVLPLAPTDFARATLPGTPMAVILPYCDGDVSNQQGQHFYDDSRYAEDDDPAFRSSLMVMGADHNFFNTEWTPGVAHAPASDDWSNRNDPVCGGTAPSRLTAAEQYAVGTAYIAGFFRLVQGREQGLLPLFDGSGGTTASAGRAVVHAVAQAPAGKRFDVAPFTSLAPSTRVSGAATAVVCAGMLDRSPQSGLPSCVSTLTTSQAPSWTPATYANNVASTPVLRFSWSDPTGTVTVPIDKRDQNVSHYDALTFRVARDETATGDVDLAVEIADKHGASRTVKVSEVSDALTPFPGTASPLPKTWLRTVRVPLSSLTGVKPQQISEIRISGASGKGAVYLADLAFSTVAAGDARSGKLPQVSVEGATVDEGDGPGTATMTVRLSDKSPTPVTVQIQTIATGAAPVIASAAQEVVIPARSLQASFQVPVNGDTAVAAEPQSYQVVASVPVNATIGNGFARLVVTDDDAV